MSGVQWGPVWPDWTNYRNFGYFLKSVCTAVWPKMIGKFLKASKSYIFLVKTALAILGDFLKILGNFLLEPSGHPVMFVYCFERQSLRCHKPI